MNIESGRETLQFPEPATQKMIAFEVLDLRWLMKTKMSACSDRLALKDYIDLEVRAFCSDSLLFATAIV